MKKLLSFTIVVSFFSSCNLAESDVSGVYVKSPSIHTIDSLFIFNDSLISDNSYNRREYLYKQVFYNKLTGQLLFENVNTWWIERDGDIAFNGFYWDNDQDHSSFVYSEDVMRDKVILFSTSMEGDRIMVDGETKYLPVAK